jgi:hypothetical protein
MKANEMTYSGKTIYTAAPMRSKLKYFYGLVSIGLFYLAYSFAQSAVTLSRGRGYFDLVQSASWGGADAVSLHALEFNAFISASTTALGLILLYLGVLRGYPNRIVVSNNALFLFFDGLLGRVRQLGASEIKSIKVVSTQVLGMPAATVCVETNYSQDVTLFTVASIHKDRAEQAKAEIEMTLKLPTVRQFEKESE